MMKFEWPLIVPDDKDVAALSQAVFDLSEYVVGIARKEELAPGLSPIDGGISVHLACHARAQNMGAMGAEMLRLLPETRVATIERCSGHGGSWGIRRDNFEVALKVGKPAAAQFVKNKTRHLCSECPLAGPHLVQAIEKFSPEAKPSPSTHPIELVAQSYGIEIAS